MTKKDTILIAVMINTALLIVLFIGGLQREETTPLEVAEQEIEMVRPLAVIEPQKQESTFSKNQEIEQVINEFSVKEEKKTKAIDFAKELEAITKAAHPPLQKEASGSNANTVIVKKGDTLEKIARNHGVSVEQIMSENHLSNTVLQIGRVLKISPKKNQGGPSEKTSQFYTVKQGDNPWTIASKNHLKLDELLKLNNLNEEKARRLKPGDELRIR